MPLASITVTDRPHLRPIYVCVTVQTLPLRLNPRSGTAVGCGAMAERTPEFFRSQIARIRGLLTGITDQQARDGLKRLVEKYEAQAAQAERREKSDETRT